jgi:hypothetical protein
MREASQCSNTRIGPTLHTRLEPNVRAWIGRLSDCVCATLGDRVVTAKPLRRLVSNLCHRSDDYVTTQSVREASQCSNTHVAATHTRLEPNIRARIGRLSVCVREFGGSW